MTERVFQLSGTCDNYPWGKLGKQSLAAQLCAKTPGNGFEVKDDQYYSEMWFGDYPDFPGRVLETGELLKARIEKNKQTLLGEKVIKNYDAQLPFLPKILSISKALPLQVHPNKELSTKLHKEDPENFTDPNHKPEIAVALSKFEVFAGFKPLDHISPLFKLPALKRFVPENTSDWSDKTLREIVRTILKSDDSTIKTAQAELSKTSKSDIPADAGYILDLLPRLQEQYGDQDPGNLVALTTMNFMTFQAGDAVYIPADGIHAYLSGDIVECMARSNNVLNTGFCPRAERNSIDMFANTLTFKAHSREDVYLPAEKTDKSKSGKTKIYRPELSEFDMLKTDLSKGESDEITASEGPGTLIVTKGSGILHADGKNFEIGEGFIFYVAPGVPIKLEAKDELQIHMAVI